jgi:hypothetical protein
LIWLGGLMCNLPSVSIGQVFLYNFFQKKKK